MPTGYSIYIERPSTIHNKLDPRTKLAWLIVMFVLSVCFNHPLPLALLNLFILAVMRIAQLKLSEVRTPILLGLWMMFLSVLLWPLYISEGNAIVYISGKPVTDVALMYGFAMGLRITLMLLSATTWMITTSPQKINAGLLRLGMPYKAGLAMSAAIRFVPLMNAERATVIEAQKARGMDFSTPNPINRLMRSAPIIVPLLTRALVTARNFAVAMDARGFGARSGRTSIIELHFTDLDRLLTILAAVGIIMGVIMRILGIGVLLRYLL